MGSVRIGMTLGQASITEQAKAEKPTLRGCNDREAAAWHGVQEYLRVNPGTPITKVFKATGIPMNLYYNAKRKAGGGLDDFCKPDPELPATRVTEPEAGEGAELVYSTGRAKQPLRDHPGLSARSEVMVPVKLEKMGTIIDRHIYPTENVQAASSEPEVKDRWAAKPTEQRAMTYDQRLKLYDAVQVLMVENDCDEQDACDLAKVPYASYLECKSVVSNAEAEEKLRRKSENKAPKTIAWEATIKAGMKEGIAAVAKDIQVFTEGPKVAPDVPPLASEDTEDLVAVGVIFKTLRRFQSQDRERVMKAVNALLGA